MSSKLTRKRAGEILKNWELISDNGIGGACLCNFTEGHHIGHLWDKTWNAGERAGSFISYYFWDDYFSEDNDNMTYLCRALSLHMLMDDNIEGEQRANQKSSEKT